MATDALISINEVVTRFFIKYPDISTRYALALTEHCINCFRDYSIYDSPNVVTEKIDISALGIIEMPDDMIGFNGLFINVQNELWAFTAKDTIVNTTTYTGLVEGQDDHFGEGGAITDPKTDDYGGVGAVNDYYYTIDWKARRIFCEGIVSDTVFLRYTTSGVETSGTTYVPEFITPMLDSYMYWKSTYFVDKLRRERDIAERDFTRAEMKIRNLQSAMTYDQWRDLFLSITTQAPLR